MRISQLANLALFSSLVALAGCAVATEPTQQSTTTLSTNADDIAAMKGNLEAHKNWDAPLFLTYDVQSAGIELDIMTCNVLHTDSFVGVHPCNLPGNASIRRALIVVTNAQGIPTSVVAEGPGGGCIHAILPGLVAGDTVRVFALERLAPGTQTNTGNDDDKGKMGIGFATITIR